MQFKEFISRQRVAILIVGVIIFIASLLASHAFGLDTLWGDLFVDLAASSVTIVFTSFIIDYLGLREQANKTKNAASLAEDEIQATCYRIKWRLARVLGMEQAGRGRDNISNRQEARDYLEKITREVDDYLSNKDFYNDKITIDTSAFQKYIERLQASQTELEQTLILYEYALSYSLREHVLGLRSELQISERLLGFIDSSELNEANLSLIRVSAQTVYDSVETVLGHDTSTATGGVPLHSKEVRVP
jgi:hypothetical protein